MKRQAGFTLIELVMVIVILGILSAFALPRFADLGTDARAAAVNGAAGAIRSAASIAHADFLVKGDSNAGTAGDQVSLEGTEINLVNEYPEVSADTASAGTADIISAAQIDTNDFTVTVAGTTVTVAAIGAAGTCRVTYTEAAANASPAIDPDTSNC